MRTRMMVSADLEEVLRIHRQAAERSGRNYVQVLSLARQHVDYVRGLLADRHGFGAVLESPSGCTLSGYALWRREQRGYRLWWVEVAHPLRRRGCGRQLVAGVCATLKGQPGREVVLADVPEANLTGQLFLRAMGFWCVNSYGAAGELLRFAFRRGSADSRETMNRGARNDRSRR